MLIKIDHTVSSLLIEDRADLIEQLTNSGKMYSWVDGENIGQTIDRFALANPRATFGDFVEWTKRTYMARLKAQEEHAIFTAYALEGDYNPTASRESNAKFGRHGDAAKGVSVIDSVPAVKKAGPRKVAEPGQEAAIDEADAAALGAEPTDNPLSPPAGVTSLPPIEPGQHSEGDTGGPVAEPSPLAKRGLGK